MRTASRFAAFLTTALVLGSAPLAAGPANAIVGGSQVADGDFAFMASIQLKEYGDGSDGHICGGSVIGTRWILTAAHCMVDTAPGEVQVGVGRTNIDNLAEGQTLNADRIVVHPDYESEGTFDAALIHVTQDIAAPSIDLTAVGEDSLEADGAELTVAGWGTEFFGSPFIPSTMKSVDVQAVADENCTTNRLQGFQDDSELCAETLLGDSCQGDSGGPLFGTVAGRVTQVGIVSYGLGCAVPAFPGVYAEVNNASIRGFISAETGL